MKSVMNHNFSQVPNAEIQRSTFDRSHGYKTTFDSGNLIPIFIDEALPGDTFNCHVTTFARLSTPIVPVMDNMFAETFFFAVPMRLVWNNWEKFNGQQTDPGDSTDYLVPQMVSAGPGYGYLSLSDYFGIPTLVPGLSHSSLFHRAYNLIWNEWFRDQNIQDSVVVDKDDGPDNPLDYILLRRGKRHDYFTSCLPWPQKGPAVTLPLGTSAPVYGAALADSGGNVVEANLWQAKTAAGAVVVGNATLQSDGTWAMVGQSNKSRISLATQAQYAAATATSEPPYADLSNATAATINALRQAFQLQRLYERDARGGTRYTEIIRAHFGVTSPDARLQRPEYLGGGSTPVTINPVAQTSSSSPPDAEDATTPQGNLAATGTFSSTGHGFVKSFTEHSIIMGMLCVRADLTYQSGLNRMFSRRTRWDFFWPALAHIGEQAVLNKEIYAQGTGNPTADEAVFGYQERYAEYRYKPSLVTGQFRSNYDESLDIWHLAQDFTALPVLQTDAFIAENPPIGRITAVEFPYPQFLLDCYFNLKCARPMPVYSVPGLIDHF